jgi:plastocyanin domain-containing protein
MTKTQRIFRSAVILWSLFSLSRYAGAEEAQPRVIRLSVTKKGFEPNSVTVKKGEPLKLVVTRKTDQTCATSIIVKDYNIERELPLNTPVEVDFTPTKEGKLKYGCAMGMMISGILLVE